MSPRSALAVAALVSLALAATAAVALLWPAAERSPAERVERIAAELRCPTCEGLSVADSPSAPAAEIRRQIGALVAAGQTDAEVRRHFVDRFGEWILLSPTAPLAWLVPPLVLVVGAMAATAWLRRRTAPPAAGPPPASPAARERVREELEALDA